jgi:hypothetical protein
MELISNNLAIHPKDLEKKEKIQNINRTKVLLKKDNCHKIGKLSQLDESRKARRSK